MTDAAEQRADEDKKAAEEQERREAENRKQIAGADPDIQHFDTTIAKLVERENADGKKEWVEVMSDNLYPGEKLKRDEDAEAKERDDELARARAAKVSDERRKSDEEALALHQAATKDAATKSAAKDQSGVTKAK